MNTGDLLTSWAFGPFLTVVAVAGGSLLAA